MRTHQDTGTLMAAEASMLDRLDQCLSSYISHNCGYRPNELIHYTNIDGLIGIIKTGSLFAGNLISMNDASEYALARDIMMQIISNSPVLRKTIGTARVVYYIKNRLENFKEVPRAFVVSFTSVSDATTQWQGYAGTSGVAIHFDAEKLQIAAVKEGAYLAPCIYKGGLQKRFVEELLADILNECQSALDAGDFKSDAEMTWLGEAALYAFAKAAGVIKSDAFQHEAEWRCVYYLPWCGLLPELPDLSRVEFENRSGMLSGHVALRMCTDEKGTCLLPITAVTIGPSQHKRINELTVPALFAKYGYGNKVSINLSHSPLRRVGN